MKLLRLLVSFIICQPQVTSSMAKFLKPGSQFIVSWNHSLRIRITSLSSSYSTSKETVDTSVNDESELKLPEAPVSCCMSGCSNCVWIDYAEEMGKLYRDGGDRAREMINKEVTDPSLKAFLLSELKFKL